MVACATFIAAGCATTDGTVLPREGWAFSSAPRPRKALRPAPPETLPDGARLVRVTLPLQTDPGTCAPVVVSGLLAHYGMPISPEWLERHAGTTPDGGTNVQHLLGIVGREVLPGSGAVLHEHLGFGTERFKRLFVAYNRLADARPGTRRIYWMPGAADLRVDRKLALADPALLRKAANSLPGRERFWRIVQDAINGGDPLLWGVVVGIVPEPLLPSTQTRGGHLRLIVGYRERPREVVFADPWGPAHAAKRLPLDDAWTETATLHSLHVSR